MLGGMLALRNVFEAVIIVLAVGFVELKLIPMQETVRIIVMASTLLPLAFLSLIGIDGESLIQYFGHILNFLRRRRVLHFGQIGGLNERKKKK